MARRKKIEHEKRLNMRVFFCKWCSAPVTGQEVGTSNRQFVFHIMDTLHHHNRCCSPECLAALGKRNAERRELEEKEQARKRAELDTEMERLESDPKALDEAIAAIRRDEHLAEVRARKAKKMGIEQRRTPPHPAIGRPAGTECRGGPNPPFP